MPMSMLHEPPRDLLPWTIFLFTWSSLKLRSNECLVSLCPKARRLQGRCQQASHRCRIFASPRTARRNLALRAMKTADLMPFLHGWKAILPGNCHGISAFFVTRCFLATTLCGLSATVLAHILILGLPQSKNKETILRRLTLF